jgi:uncharacterized protein
MNPLNIYSIKKLHAFTILIMVCVLLVIAPSCSTSPKTDTMNIAVITKTAGFRHNNIDVAVEALRKMATENNWKLYHTEDSLYFSPANLDTLDLVIFLQTTDNIFGADQQQAIQDFVEKGGGLLTIHTGTITEHHWPWFVEVIGARFIGHPPVQKGKLIIEDRTHPATSFLPDSIWIIEDEWYSFDRNPREEVNVLISIDEASYDVDDNKWFDGINQRMGDHPMVWYRNAGKGRIFQTALGHPAELYSDPLFLKHIHGAIVWTAGMEQKNPERVQQQ